MAPHALTATWDCHAHLFGPYERYPLVNTGVHNPPVADAASYAALLERLGAKHGVLVQPSAYGSDHRLLLDTLADHAAWRGVAVYTAPDHAQLPGLRQRGVRGLRFSHRSGPAGNFKGSATWSDLNALANTLADEGLHAELWTDVQALPDLEPLLRTLPVPVVIDHMGGFDANAGVDQPGFAALRRLLSDGHVWVKLCAYRNLFGQPPDAGHPYVRALVQANPDQLVWGSDWPHLRVDPMPDAAELLQQLRHGVDDEQVCERILATNPGRLYT